MARSSRSTSRPTVAGLGAGPAPAGIPEKAKRGRKPGRPRGPGRPRAARKPREGKNVISRLISMAKVIFGKGDKLHTLMGNISAEATPDQTRLFQVVGVALAGVRGKAGAVVEALEALAKTGFDPVLVKKARGPKGLSAGATVAIKPKRWNPALYGKINNFEVVVCVDKMVRLQSAADSKAPQFVLAQAWVEEIEAPADDPTDPVAKPAPALDDIDPDDTAPPDEDATEELPE